MLKSIIVNVLLDTVNRILLSLRKHSAVERWSVRSLRRQVGTLAAWCAVAGVIIVSIVIIYAKTTLPDPESIISRQVKESTKIYDRTGEVVLYDIYSGERRTVVESADISDSVKQATVAVEDSRFYEHRGFDFRGFVRSVLNNIQQGYGSGGGGSTITQQLVGNALVGRQKTLFRKVQELILSIEVERRFTKDEILTMYLNQVPYGSNAYGIEAAANLYFGVPASELTLGQATTLAALPQRPSYLSPYGNHGDELMARKNFVLDRMLALGMITEEEYTEAQVEELVFEEPSSTLAAPHFVIMVREYVIEKYGQDIVESGGFKIITTLDADLQKKAEATVAKHAEINKEKFNATNAALVAIDPVTGGVRALVGSADYFDIENEGNFNVATALRQPGSSFKPFAYATAFAKGYPDSSVVWDLPTEFNPLCPPNATGTKDQYGQDCYHPKNYNGLFSGPVTLRQALARSLNVPSVKTLYLAGISDTLDLATRMGITTLEDRSRFGLSLVLGGAEVRPIDLVSAYGVFANDGIRVPWGLVQEIQSNDGALLEQRQEVESRALDAQTARLVTNVLSDNNARAPVFGTNSYLYIPGYDIAAKTGTTQENRDAWLVGYNPAIAVGVWVGNNRNQSMTSSSSGASAAGPLWNEFMRSALTIVTPKPFINPDPVLTNKIMLNGTYISPEYPIPHSLLFYVSKDNPLGSIPSDPNQDDQFPNWEWSVVQRTATP